MASWPQGLKEGERHGNVYAACEDDTPEMICGKFGVDLEQFLTHNSTYYKGVKNNSRLYALTLVELPGIPQEADEKGENQEDASFSPSECEPKRTRGKCRPRNSNRARSRRSTKKTVGGRAFSKNSALNYAEAFLWEENGVMVFLKQWKWGQRYAARVKEQGVDGRVLLELPAELWLNALCVHDKRHRRTLTNEVNRLKSLIC